MNIDDPQTIIRPLDDLILWWGYAQDEICKNERMSKEYDDLTKKVKDYRRKTYDALTEDYHLKYAIFHICSLRLLNGSLEQSLGTIKDCFCGRWGDTQRRLGRVNAGFAVQALVTKWFHEVGFQIADIEVKHKDSEDREHNFDAEIEDKSGSKYDIEVWHGRGVMPHERDSSADNYLLDKGGTILCEVKGVWNESMKYVSEHGGIGDDADANRLNLGKKIKQLRRDRVGFVIACTRREMPFESLLVPPSWGSNLPDKKCVIVLLLGDGDTQTVEKRGIGYVVHSRGFEAVEAAKNIIRSLKFECIDGNSLTVRMWL